MYLVLTNAPSAGVPSDADPLGLCCSPLYPRVMQHANEVVGISTPQSASVAMDVLVDLECTRARTRTRVIRPSRPPPLRSSFPPLSAHPSLFG